MSKQSEYIKCYNDKTRIYFIENYLYTFNAMESVETPFILFPRQKEFLKSCAYKNETIALKPRQAGITTCSAAWVCGEITFSPKGSPQIILCLANKLDQAVEIVNKIVNFLDQVPRWMWGGDFYSPDPDNPKNTKSIYLKRNKNYVELFNGSKIYARASGPHSARGISSVKCVIIDEASFLQDVSGYSAARACQSSVANPKCIMVSTPNGKDQLYYKTYSQAVKGENNFNVVEFKWFQDPRYNRNLRWYKKDEKTGDIKWDEDPVIDRKGNIEYNEERWRNLERDGWTPTSPWFENMCKSFNNDQQKIAQELLVSFLGSSDNVVAPEVIEMHQKQNVIPITPDWPLRDQLISDTWIWKDPIPGHRYLCACLPEGEKVMTDSGLVNIEDVKINDKLFDKDGAKTKIKKFIKREYDDVIYSIKLKNILNTVKFTGEHPIWSSINPKLRRVMEKESGIKRRFREFNFRFNNASELNTGDWVAFPNIYKHDILSDEEISRMWNKYSKGIRECSSIKNPLLEEEFWWYCGMWLAEGYVYKCSKEYLYIHTSHNTNETEIHERIRKLTKNIFGRSITKLKKGENACDITFCSKQIGAFLSDNFGKYAHGKYISEWIKHLPKKFKVKLIEGYLMGDGCINKNKTSDYVSVSDKLLNDVQNILFSIGIVSSIKKHNDECESIICGRKCKCKKKYYLHIGKHDNKKLFEMAGIKCDIETVEGRRKISNCYMSDDEDYIYIQISKIDKTDYKGYVYNFETESHTFCNNYIASHNCDPSSGSGTDFTAIEVIDVDAVDENGTPFFEQVLEYNGKINGEEVGELVNRYGRVYNNALAVVEALGGYGDAVVLTLMNLGYPNLYYDESTLKNYTSAITASKFNKKAGEALPGFRSNGLRIQMISNFVEMLKNDSFRVRSMRVISELETWIFKNGRPDHQDGMCDDLLTCLAMGLFVAIFYMLRNERKKAKDSQIVKSWYVNNANNSDFRSSKLENRMIISSPRKMPFYSNSQIEKRERARFNAMLLLGGFKRH